MTKQLFGISGAGWSDRIKVTAHEVDASTPLGVCSGGGGGGGGGNASCNSATLGRDVDDGTCVQSASDGDWYQCQNGSWVGRSSSSGCATAFAWCSSATLGKDVPPRTCVQSASSGNWFQCNGQSWVTPVDTGAETGPIGACSSWNPL